jgi:hypothetical protein
MSLFRWRKWIGHAEKARFGASIAVSTSPRDMALRRGPRVRCFPRAIPGASALKILVSGIRVGRCAANASAGCSRSVNRRVLHFHHLRQESCARRGSWSTYCLPAEPDHVVSLLHVNAHVQKPFGAVLLLAESDLAAPGSIRSRSSTFSP